MTPLWALLSYVRAVNGAWLSFATKLVEEEKRKKAELKALGKSGSKGSAIGKSTSKADVVQQSGSQIGIDKSKSASQ